ncbi:glycosyltransferase [Roseibium salinum]|nr:glycosyltransferase [Roseibium salinum]
MDELKTLAATLGVTERTHFLGWQRDPSPFLKAADILVCPSDDEPLGNVVLEGWNAGLPVIATASQGPSWLIEHGKTGLLVDCGDVEGLVGGVEGVMGSESLENQLILGAAKCLDDRYSEDHTLISYLGIVA